MMLHQRMKHVQRSILKLISSFCCLLFCSQLAVSQTCPSGLVYSSTTSGTAQTVIVSASFSSNATGVLTAAGTTSNNTNSAKANSSNPELTLKLEHIVPEGVNLTISLARNNSGSDFDINTATTPSGAFINQLIYDTGTEDILEHISLPVPAGGVEYVQFVRFNGSLWIDGISYIGACVPATTSLDAIKTVAVYDPTSSGLYSVPGNDVIYTFSIVNTGDTNIASDSMVLIDKFPDEIMFWNGDIDANGPDYFSGSTPVGFVQSSGNGVSLTYNTDVRFSTGTVKPANFSACSTVAVDNIYRADLTYICLNPKGILSAGATDPSIAISFRAQIK